MSDSQHDHPPSSYHTPVRAAPKRSLDLLALFHSLCLEGFEANFWGRLPREAQEALRRTCKDTAQLGDLLLTSAKLTLPLSKFSSTLLPTSATRHPWQQALPRTTAFLSRQPRLTALELLRWPCEEDLVTALSQWGGATQQRVTQLTLRGSSPLSEAGVAAIRQACPRLSVLELSHLGRSAAGMETRRHLQLQGPVFQAFRDSQHLTKLVIDHGVNAAHDVMSTPTRLPPAALRSLRGLSHLQHLHLSVGRLPTAALLHDLTGLSGLLHCAVDVREPRLCISDACALLTDATGLTSLQLLNVNYPMPVTPPTSPAIVPAPPTVATALSLLGGLADLHSLDLSPTFMVGDAAFAAISRLSRLTRLCVGGIGLSDPKPGHLPALQVLRLGTGVNAHVPSRLLAAVLPLLPLPCLTELDGGRLCLDTGHGAGDDVGAAAAAALASVVRHLAAAPKLQVGDTLTLSSHGDSATQLRLTAAAAGLAPLAGRVTRLVLSYSRASWTMSGWTALAAALPGLTRLDLDCCKLWPAGLAAILSGQTQLQHLRVHHSGHDFGHEAWVNAAIVCGRAVAIETSPALPRTTVALCRVAEMVMFEQHHITWLNVDQDTPPPGSLVLAD